MVKRENLDVSAYLVIGPENTCGRSVESVVYAAVMAGFTCVQVRSKTASAKALIALLAKAQEAIERAGAASKVALLVNDRVDVAYAARCKGIAVDGVHVGQSDVEPGVCRKLLGESAIVGLTAPEHNLVSFTQTANLACVDYLGVAPLHATQTKAECGLEKNGEYNTLKLSEIEQLHVESPVPFVVGGGVTLHDVPALKQAGANGFFVVSAVCAAKNPQAAASELVSSWK